MRLFNGGWCGTRWASQKLGDVSGFGRLEDAVYNLVRPLKTLRREVHDAPGQRWRPRTPAIAAGLTNHIWTVKELLTTVVLPTLDGRLSKSWNPIYTDKAGIAEAKAYAILCERGMGERVSAEAGQ